MPASAEAALAAADAMMYAAKAGGKDQVRSARYEQAG
jgi:PleD family two-component response regulator